MKRKFLLAFCLCAALSLHAQQTDELERNLRTNKQVAQFEMNKNLGSPSFISFNKGAGATAQNAEAIIRQNYGLKTREEQLVLFATTTLKSGMEVRKYKLVYNGVPVEHSAYIVNILNGEIASINSEAYKFGSGASIKPTLSEEAALQRALSFVNAKAYAWQALEGDNQLMKTNPDLVEKFQQMKQDLQPKGKLVFAKNVYGNGQVRLAWKYDIYAADPISRQYVYVDAETGKILLSDAIIKHSNKLNAAVQNNKGKEFKNIPAPARVPGPVRASKIRQAPQLQLPFMSASTPGTAQTRYVGTRNIYTTKVTVGLLGTTDPNNGILSLTYSGIDPRIPVTSSSVYILKDDTRGAGIETYDMNGIGGLPLSIPALQIAALAFTDIDNNWKNETGLLTRQDLIRGTTSNGTNGVDEALNDDFAMDAHWGAEMVYDYWKVRHGRLSFDNANGLIKNFVHFGPAYDNAFWDGATMTYGDGSGTALPVSATGSFRPLTALDVCGHEIGHGVCSFTSDLVYESESGAMNEGLSDVWGAAIENFVNAPPLSFGITFYPFQIGEQISADNIGLRRMDNPKANGNPDTYGGTNWINPVCTPSLANDQCGVHTNSGVLNKYFYLLVNGPGATTGSPAYTDDGVSDNGNIYAGTGSPIPTGEFVGLGFLKAEAITYLMELNLTPNATFADARVAAINAAKLLYGVCSQEVKTVTNAWYAVNVGANYGGCSSVSKQAEELIVKEPSVKIYPNVTTNYTTIHGLSAGQTIYLLSNRGQQVMKVQATGATQQINLDNLTDGDYYITVADKDQKVFTGKVIKRR